MLFQLPGRQGVGKLGSAADGVCILEIFRSILRTDTVEMPIEALDRAYLSPQTRVYVPHEEGFRVGRVTNYLRQDTGLIDYEVRFPNGRQSDFSEVLLHVRPWNAPEDPAEILAAGGAESQYLHDRRQSAVAPLLRLRSAAQGLTALLSAGVEFVPHQVAAVRRVLTDPIQRYLLADEVGLGKTIEAGLIIRQHLIDNPDIGVLIATPSHLCEQWRGEMTHKLRLDQFGDPFECVSHADLARVGRTPDMLVVDEAHHLVGVTEGPLAVAAQRLATLAADAPILLLLSATPPLGEESRFLALLNLLDPDTHKLEDLEGFRAKLEQRRDIGRLLLSLDSDSPGLVLRKRGEEMQDLFADDHVIMTLAPQLIEATRTDGEKVASLCAAIKTHVADTYRIHQRLIRSRRADAKGWEFMPRGPICEDGVSLGHVRLEADPTDEIASLLGGIEDWRYAAIEGAGGDERLLAASARQYVHLLEALGTGREAFLAALDEPVLSAGDLGEIVDALRANAEDFDDSGRIDTMAQSTTRLLKTLKVDTAHPKIVAFTPTQALATRFADGLKDLDDEVAIDRLSGSGAEDNAEAIERFEQPATSAILIADSSGEEGLNLACADAIVHLDLPFSAARLEQRIGRLDRFGRRQAIIRHRILLPSDEDDSPWAAWFAFLTEGLLIFNRSISDVQFLLDEIEAEAFLILFRDGPDALLASAPAVRSRIAAERKSQDEQYALDRIALADEPVETFIEALEDAESDEAALEQQVDRWLVDTLMLKKRPFAWPDEDPFKLGTAHTTLIPKEPWLSEFGVDDTMPLTWRRRIASRHPDATLLRPGTPFVDMVDRFTRWDDRGTAFMTWRVAPAWADTPWIGFRLCFVIEPDIAVSDLLAPTFAEQAALRHAQRYLPSSYHVLHVDTHGSPVSDPVLTRALALPYRGPDQKGTDTNLSSRPKLLEQVIDIDSFRACCRQVRDTARESLRAMPDMETMIGSAASLAASDLERRRNRLNRRHSSGDAKARADLEMLEGLVPAITNPAIRLDAMGCFIIASHPPHGHAA
jgi:ATP-dependent helicase HepA